MGSESLSENSALTFNFALLPDGVSEGVRIVFDSDGVITTVTTGVRGPYDGYFALPGMPNAHSHAFQRALAGYGEQRFGDDSFWSWREAMYRLAAGVGPDDMFVIARRAFDDMLAAGFTAVGEFHYLHHKPDGSPGPEMGQAVKAAADESGIRLALLPVYYETGGFDEPVHPQQKRFVHDSVDSFLRLMEQLPASGIAPHSLRAVPYERLDELINGVTAQLGNCPIHIHVSEQKTEVDSCRKHFGKTPIALLDDATELNERWNLVHATHATETELETVHSRNACIVLCPLTEAYLGDGIFSGIRFLQDNGRVAVGSDSNARIDAAEEVRWLEYGQRLRNQRRAQLSDDRGLGIPLWSRLAQAGGHAIGETVGTLETGSFADVVVLDDKVSPLAGPGNESFVDAWIVGGDRSNIEAVYIGGKRRVERGHIDGTDANRSEFSECVTRLLQA